MVKKYIHKNTKLRKKANNEIKKDVFKLVNNSVLGKKLENVRKHKDIKLVTTQEQRSKLVSESNYHTAKHFTENLFGIEMKKAKVTMKKPLYLGMTILDITLMYKFWYDYIKPKYGDRAKLCWTDADSFIIHIFTENFFEDIAGYVERQFDTSNYAENNKRPFSIGMNKKELGFFKDELGEKIRKEFLYLMDEKKRKEKSQRNKKMCNKT